MLNTNLIFPAPQFRCFALGALILGCGFAQAETASTSVKPGQTKDKGFAGPTSTGALLEEDRLPKEPAVHFPFADQVFDPWFAWKECLKENHGFEFGVAYTSLLQASSHSLPGFGDTASSGILRLSGQWKFLNRGGENEGKLVMSVDHRHRYGSQVPANLGFDSGYYGITGTLFSDASNLLGDLYWAQSFNEGRSGFVIGRFDPNDFFDVSGHANPWTTFQNLSILFNPSVALPDWGTGIGFGHWIDDQWYVKGAVSDVNSVATDTKVFEDFGELYSTAEVGWSPSPEERYLKNFHIMGWHADKREDDGVPESYGFSLGANWTWDNDFMLFGRVGFSDGAAPLYDKTATLGGLWRFEERSDLLGFGVNWGNPSDDSLRSQWTTEVFYRFQLTENIAVTPSIQWVVNLALDESEDQLVIGGLRTRFSF